jgi:hypothetical protein
MGELSLICKIVVGLLCAYGIYLCMKEIKK